MKQMDAKLFTEHMDAKLFGSGEYTFTFAVVPFSPKSHWSRSTVHIKMAAEECPDHPNLSAHA